MISCCSYTHTKNKVGKKERDTSFQGSRF